MPRDATLHVKLQSELAQHLKRLAKSRGVSLSSLVRQAIAAAYQPDLLNLISSTWHNRNGTPLKHTRAAISASVALPRQWACMFYRLETG